MIQLAKGAPPPTMEAPAAQVESEPAQGKLQRCLLCEPWWAERPLEHCCICIMPLRKGALMACGVAFALSLGHTIEFGSLLSHSEDEAPPAFLKFLYFVQLLAMLAVMLGSIVTFASVYTQHAQLRSAPLLFSKLLRYSFWLFFFSFFFMWFRSNETCKDVAVDAQGEALASACRCLKEQSLGAGDAPGAVFSVVDSKLCAAKQYHTCDLPELPPARSQEETRLRITQMNDCRWCGLNLDGDVTGDGVIDSTPCTPDECLDLGCAYETHLCPAAEEDFIHSLDLQAAAASALLAGNESTALRLRHYFQIEIEGFDECVYDEEGRLLSLNITASGPHSAVDDYLSQGVFTLTEQVDEQVEQSGMRGGWSVDSDLAAAANSSVGLGECYVETIQMSSEARRFEKECYAVIWGINIFVNFVTMLLCFHYARVFYSLYLDKTFATGASQGAPPLPPSPPPSPGTAPRCADSGCGCGRQHRQHCRGAGGQRRGRRQRSGARQDGRQRHQREAMNESCHVVHQLYLGTQASIAFVIRLLKLIWQRVKVVFV